MEIGTSSGERNLLLSSSEQVVSASLLKKRWIHPAAGFIMAKRNGGNR
jgi:hypothetical protein